MTPEQRITEAAKSDRKPPANPFYCKLYTTTVNGGYAHVSIPAPGGVVSHQDAAYLIEWFGLIVKQLERDKSEEPTHDQTNHSRENNN